ncbi:RICIN domain-containing protein [Actinoallomurus sp. NBC_01490]|uniref:RICIN domain-containing protein n=1 Tax=Actinoallomurus sp. NBC_01490 TaxID=2903557 RepID=UPI002E37FCD7|nr:RICIN domain-containing protein [Actinoallomurus sp. NBC_01490]
MASKSGSGERAESLGVRRPVELPETDIDAAGNLAPADSEPESGEAAGDGEETADAKATSDAGETAQAKEPQAETAAQAKGGQSLATATDVAVATPGADGDADGDGMPPDRPKKPVLAAVAIGGAVVLAVPILLIGTGSHHGEKHPTTAAADNVLPGDAQPPAGAFTSQSPTPTPTPSPSASAKKKTKADKKNADETKTVASAKTKVWPGVSNVLLKNAASGLCADIPGYGKGSADGKVAQYYCTLGDSDNQVWSLGVMSGMKGPGGTALFLIRNTKDNLCMDLPYYKGVSAGTKVTEYYCRPKGDNQLWYRSHTHGKRYRIRNYASHGLCLGPTGRSHARDKQLEVHKCGSGDEWSWPSGT